MTGPFLYRIHDHNADDLGLIEHPAPNLEPGDGDVIVLADGREALVTTRLEGSPSGRLTAMLQVAVAEAG